MPDGIEKIEHLIVLMMENRSFDHYLGSLALEGRADIDGLPDPLPAIPDTAGNPVQAWDIAASDVAYKYCGYADPPHGPGAQVANYDNGNNDGFVKQYQAKYPTGQSSDTPPAQAPANLPMAYYTRTTLPVLYSLADQFTVCDHWFCSMLSSTWPNRKYLHSGQRDDDADTQTIPAFPGFQTTPLYTVLDAAGLTWKCYFSDLPFLAYWYKFAAFHALDNFTSVDNFVTDCREDNLPAISVIDPPFSLADDHPAHDVRLGQKFIGLIVDALTNSQSWASSALVILYDENGGFYDHEVPPHSFEVQNGQPPDRDDPLGFRVPALIVSPYAKPRFVSKVAYDHTSIMKSISTRWGVEFPTDVYGTRWKVAPDIWTDGFDFTRTPVMQTYAQTSMEIQHMDWGSGVYETLTSPVGTLEGLLERIFLLPGLKILDHRARVYDHLQALQANTIVLKRMSPGHP